MCVCVFLFDLFILFYFAILKGLLVFFSIFSRRFQQILVLFCLSGPARVDIAELGVVCLAKPWLYYQRPS